MGEQGEAIYEEGRGYAFRASVGPYLFDHLIVFTRIQDRCKKYGKPVILKLARGGREISGRDLLDMTAEIVSPIHKKPSDYREDLEVVVFGKDSIARVFAEEMMSWFEEARRLADDTAMLMRYAQARH